MVAKRPLRGPRPRMDLRAPRKLLPAVPTAAVPAEADSAVHKAHGQKGDHGMEGLGQNSLTKGDDNVHAAETGTASARERRLDGR